MQEPCNFQPDLRTQKGGVMQPRPIAVPRGTIIRACITASRVCTQCSLPDERTFRLPRLKLQMLARQATVISRCACHVPKTPIRQLTSPTLSEAFHSPLSSWSAFLHFAQPFTCRALFVLSVRTALLHSCFGFGYCNPLRHNVRHLRLQCLRLSRPVPLLSV